VLMIITFNPAELREKSRLRLSTHYEKCDIEYTAHKHYYTKLAHARKRNIEKTQRNLHIFTQATVVLPKGYMDVSKPSKRAVYLVGDLVTSL